MTPPRAARPTRWLAITAALAALASACTGGGGAKAGPSGSAPRATVSYRLEVTSAGFSLPAPVQRAVAVVSGGTVYVAGGLDAAQQSVNGVYALSPGTGKLTSLGSVPQPFHDAAAAMLGGRLFVFGGGAAESSDTVQTFDPATRAGRVAGRLPRPLSDLSAATVGGTLYLVGGFDGRAAQDAIYATTDGTTFRQVGRLPQGLRYTAVASDGTGLVIAGGETASGPVSTVLRFDPRSGRVTLVGNLPQAVGHAAAFALGGAVYVAGGQDAAGVAVRQVVAVQPASRSIRPVGSLPAAVSDAAVAANGSEAWLIGGWRGSAVAEVFRATLVRMVSPAPGSSPASPSAAQAAGSVRPFAGLLLIADRGNNRLLVMDSSRRILWRYPAPGLPAPPFNFYFPDDAFWVHGGHAILVNEEENHVLAEIAYPSGKTIWTYGHPNSPGSGSGYLNQPDDVYPVPGGGLVVADAKNCRLQFFDAGGIPTRQIGVTASPDVPGACFHQPPQHLGYPNGDTPLPNGDILLSELRGGWVSEITSRGQVVWAVQPRGVTLPSDPQPLPDGSVVVVDYNTPGKIVRFRSDGTVVWTYFVTTGIGELKNSSLAAPLPNGLVAANDDYNDRVIFIDPATNRIVWQYGHTGVPGSSAGYLNTPDGFDLLLPDGTTPLHLDFSSPQVVPGRP